MVKKSKKTAPKKVEPAVEFHPPVTASELLQDHLLLCRRFGVLSWDGPVHGIGSVKFSLAPQLASDPEIVSPSPAKEAVPVTDSVPKSDPKVGADGLSADMQEELLGRVMDAKR